MFHVKHHRNGTQPRTEQHFRDAVSCGSSKRCTLRARRGGGALSCSVIASVNSACAPRTVRNPGFGDSGHRRREVAVPTRGPDAIGTRDLRNRTSRNCAAERQRSPTSGSPLQSPTHLRPPLTTSSTRAGLRQIRKKGRPKSPLPGNPIAPQPTSGARPPDDRAPRPRSPSLRGGHHAGTRG